MAAFRLIQYLLLASLKDGKVDTAAYTAAAKKVHAFSNQIDADVPTLDQCVKAFPNTATAKPVQLPDDPKTRLFGCDSLLEGLGFSMTTGDPPYLDQRKYDLMSNRFAKDMAQTIKDKTISLADATALRDSLLPQMLALGNSTKVLQACYAAFPPKA